MSGPASKLETQEPRYFRNCWYVADWADQIVHGQIISRTIAGEPVALYRRTDGTLAALADRCCHRFAPLSLGRVEVDDVRCGYHGAKFNAEGHCLEFPGVDRVPAKFCLKSYPVVERHRWAWVWIGDREAADMSLIPEAVYHDRADMVVRQGQMTYQVNHTLVSDNLLDFSHLAYVHPNSFGAGPSWADVRADVIELPRGVRVQRWLLDQPPWPFLPQTGRIDVFNTYDYLWPGVLILAGRNYPAGTASACEYKLPPESQLLSMGATCQAITPVDERTTEYRFSSITPEVQATEEVVSSRHATTLKAFGEDRVMLEGQERIIALSRGMQMMPMAHDKASVIFRRQLVSCPAAERVELGKDPCSDL